MVKSGDIVEYHRDDHAFPEYEGFLGVVEETKQELGTLRCRVAWFSRNIPSVWYDAYPSKFAVVRKLGEVQHG